MRRNETVGFGTGDAPVVDDALIDTLPVGAGDAPAYPPISPSDFDAFANGERDLGELPFYVDELRQIRQEYDPDGLIALASAMKRRDGQAPYIWQINSIQVNEFDNEAALGQYLEKYGQFYGIDEPIDVADLHRRPDGTWRVLIAGHRRNRAMYLLARQKGYQLKEQDVKMDVYTNMSFEDAIAMQGRENEHVRIKPEEAAEDIKRHYDFYIQNNNGAIPTYTEIAQISGYTPARVSEALRYCELPQEIKREYTSGMIQYSMAVKCHALWRAYNRLYVTKYPDTYGVHVMGGIERLANDSRDAVLAFINHLKSAHLARMSSAQKMESLEIQVRMVEQAATYVSDELFELSEYDSPAERRDRSGRRLGAYAAQVVLARLEGGDELSPTELDTLKQISEAFAEYQKRASGGNPDDVRPFPSLFEDDESLSRVS